MRISKNLLAIFLPPIVVATGAQAEGTWTIGAFAFGETGYYAGQDDEVELLPYVSFETERFEFSLTDGVTYHAFRADGPDGNEAQVSFILSPRFAPGFSDDPVFVGLARDTAIEAGIRGAYQAGLFFAEAEALVDVSKTHKGYEASAFAGVQVEAGSLTVEGGVGARYRSDALNQYLFGVSAAEATTTRAEYFPGASTTAFASITAIYALNNTMALIGDLTFEDLGNAERSPLVKESATTSLTLGLVYQF